MKTSLEISLCLTVHDPAMREYSVSVHGQLPSLAAYSDLFPVALELLTHAGAPPIPLTILPESHPPTQTQTNDG